MEGRLKIDVISSSMSSACAHLKQAGRLNKAAHAIRCECLDSDHRRLARTGFRLRFCQPHEGLALDLILTRW